MAQMNYSKLIRTKVECFGKRLFKFHEAPHTVAQLYGLPHGILHAFYTSLYEIEFQNPQIFQQTISLFPEQSTLYSTYS
jgi:hypothetical protein